MLVYGTAIVSAAMFAGGLAAAAALFWLCGRWGEAAALRQARQMAARLRAPATTLAQVEDQAEAVEELVHFRNDRAAIAAALELMDEMDATVRSDAIEVLRRARAFDHWSRDLRRGGHRAKIRAIEALGRVGDERAIGELIECLGDDDPDVARAAAKAVVWRDFDYSSEQLADALASPKRPIAETAAAVLVQMGEEAVEALVGQLANLSPQARRLAAESLGSIGAPGLDELLPPLLESDPDPEVRVAVAEALARAQGEPALSHLKRLAGADADWFVRARAFSLIAEANAPGAGEFLLESLTAIESEIARTGEESNAVEVVQDGAQRVKAAILTGLRTLGLTDEEIAEAERSGGRAAALEGEGGTIADWSEAIAGLRGRDPARRAQAAGQLAEAGRAAAPVVAEALHDPDPLVRSEAARSLGRIGGTDSLEALGGCMRDPDAGVRLAAATAMRAIVTRDAARQLAD